MNSKLILSCAKIGPPEQVATRFGRKIGEVRRDLQAQVLYRDFLEWEKSRGREHRVAYNAFSEAVRSKSIKNWLGWSKEEYQIENKEAEKAFFLYLSTRFPPAEKVVDGDDDDDLEPPSVEKAVRHLKAMLDVQDEDIVEALESAEFDTAEALFETRKEGKIAKRIKGYIRNLKNSTASELQDGAEENQQRLRELLDIIHALLAQLEWYLAKKKKPTNGNRKR